MFAKNLTSLRKERKLTQEAAASALGLKRSTYAYYENGKSEPSASILLKLADFFQVSAEMLVRGQLAAPPLFRQSPEPQPALQKDVRVLAITVGEEQQENIQYVPVAAVAGYASEFNQAEFIERLPHFRLPKLGPGTYRAFDVQGDSMPPIHDGYILIGRFVEYARNLQDGNRYILVTKNAGVVFKRITRDAARPARLILTSDNPTFSPYSLDLAEVLEAWEMAAFVGFPTVYQDSFPLLNERLQGIEQRLDRLIPKS
ncbi:LexA family transcriptional regulator [Hymenobacter sp. DH14]|uniref:LexA family transcriptional regulator n=1 Tax=Hymenobacter cyanobacteriorum TaxID=2926463 RepID=A0A9X1VHK1_9BACT|nr:LexA family transcriptional regulator [Hymenobacter cyanobacteriorum]MCI1188745.1 LexA family transcriptional regulator [Hymenobacter cyanobacteriorum]